jgi:hypothetical protein
MFSSIGGYHCPNALFAASTASILHNVYYRVWKEDQEIILQY